MRFPKEVLDYILGTIRPDYISWQRYCRIGLLVDKVINLNIKIFIRLMAKYIWSTLDKASLKIFYLLPTHFFSNKNRHKASRNLHNPSSSGMF